MRETDRVTWWAAIDTESVSDSGSSITVLAVSLTLVALGIALLGVTVWFWRLTRPDPDALGPLAVMSDRDFLRRGPIEQRRALDAARPDAIVIDAPDEVPDEMVHEAEDELVLELADVVDVDVETPEVEVEYLDDEPEFEIESDVVDDMNEDPAPVSRAPSIDPLL